MSEPEDWRNRDPGDLSGLHITLDDETMDFIRSVNWSGIDLSEAAMQRDILEARLRSGWTDFRGCDFSGMDLEGWDFSGCDCTGANFRDAKMKGVRMCGAVLNDADLTGADAQEADLTWARLEGAIVEDAFLAGANARGAFITRLRTAGAVMSGVDAREASVLDTDFTAAPPARLDGMVFAGGIVEGCRVTSAQADAAHFGGAKIRRTEITDPRPAEAEVGRDTLEEPPP